MANVLQLDASANTYGVGVNLGSPQSDVWFSFYVAVNSTLLTWLLAQSANIFELCEINNAAQSVFVDLGYATPSGNFAGEAASPYSSHTFGSGIAAANQFYSVEIHVTPGSPPGYEAFLGGTSLGTFTSGVSLSDVQVIYLFAGGSAAGGLIYFDNFKIGTSRGASDLFADDFEGSLPGGWNQTYNSSVASIIADPGITPPAAPPATPHGVLIAFEADVLEESPTWTDLNSLAGVSVQRVEVNRGRPTERDKTQVGTATIHGVCTTGILDPTYAAGTYFGKLDPMKQVQIELQNPVTSDWSSIFRGYVSDWNYELDLAENTYTFEIDCEDALAIISDAEVIPDVAGNTVPAESTGDVYYDPAASNDDRLLAAIADTATTFNPYGADWPSGLLSFATGNTKVKGQVYSPRTSLLQVIDDGADADLPWGSNRYVSKTGIVTFKGRLQRFDPTNPTYNITFWTVGDEAAFTGDSSTALISSLKFTRGKTNLINSVLITPKDIKDADIAGQFASDSTSITAYGARTASFENILTDGSASGASWGPTTDLQETALMASGMVSNYKDPLTRVSEVTFRPKPTAGTRGTAVWALACDVELNDVFTVTVSIPGGGGFSADDQFVESLAYTWDVEGGSEFTNVTLTAELSPRANWNTNPFV